MSVHPAVEWTLDQVNVATDELSAPVRRVDRDLSREYETGSTIDMSTPIHTRKTQLEAANYVSASFADRSSDPVGTSYDLDVDVVVNVRIEGLTAVKGGHVDPEGNGGDPFGTLVDAVRSALFDQRSYPDSGRSAESFTHLTISNEDPQSVGWDDFFRHEFDVGFDGFEQL